MFLSDLVYIAPLNLIQIHKFFIICISYLLYYIIQVLFY